MASPPITNHPTIGAWLSTNNSRDVLDSQRQDNPNYWTSDPSSLTTRSDLHSLHLGTGSNIYTAILPSLEAAEHEIILVTCFWARSTSLNQFNTTLLKLSAKGIANGRKLRVRICFSSCSLWQKLFHTWSLKGTTYPASSWTNTLGLPRPDELQGLDLEIKSIFILPFSVMHPKFIIVDRKTAFLLSCNVSWEDWFEGCLEMSGSVVDQYIRFWTSFWASEADKAIPWSPPPSHSSNLPTSNTYLLASKHLQTTNVTTLFLPSPHHVNPRFRLPFQTKVPPPDTPLNTFLITAISRAEKEIFIQTPNLTSQPVLAALLAALTRGVCVRIVTSERLMLLEQLVTAGTTTARCVRWLIKGYKSLSRPGGDVDDLEAGTTAGLGGLKVAYYTSHEKGARGGDEPVQSHFKLTVVDGEVAVFGSGNMDRASWFTSQELGVAVWSREVVRAVEGALEQALEGRTSVVFDSVMANR